MQHLQKITFSCCNSCKKKKKNIYEVSNNWGFWKEVVGVEQLIPQGDVQLPGSYLMTRKGLICLAPLLGRRTKNSSTCFLHIARQKKKKKKYRHCFIKRWHQPAPSVDESTLLSCHRISSPFWLTILTEWIYFCWKNRNNYLKKREKKWE